MPGTAGGRGGWGPGPRRGRAASPNCCSACTASCMWIQKRSLPSEILSYDTVRGSSAVERLMA